MSRSLLRTMVGGLMVMVLVPWLVACGSEINTTPPVPTVTINPNFQVRLSPMPTTPPYRCGAWTSTNAPGRGDTIAIYARLMHDLQGVSGRQASAIVHFQSADYTLPANPTSDAGGYVSFTLNLQGRQPARVPATIDVSFSGLPDGTLHCTPAFFTPV